jgi:hypothetical protein
VTVTVDDADSIDPGLLLVAILVVGALAKSGAGASAAGIVGAPAAEPMRWAVPARRKT